MAKDYIKTDITSVQQSVERANGLANAHYIDPAVFAEESEAVLKATWAGPSLLIFSFLASALGAAGAIVSSGLEAIKSTI